MQTDRYSVTGTFGKRGISGQIGVAGECVCGLIGTKVGDELITKDDELVDGKLVINDINGGSVIKLGIRNSEGLCKVVKFVPNGETVKIAGNYCGRRHGPTEEDHCTARIILTEL